MNVLIDIAQACLADLKLETRRVKDLPILNLTVQSPNGKLDMFVHAHEDNQRLLVYSRPQGINLKPIDIAAMAEFLTRANYGLFVGNFELDYSDGEVRFKTSLSVQGSRMNSALISEVVTPSLLLMDQYLPGLNAVATGQMSPQAAIEWVESAEIGRAHV